MGHRAAIGFRVDVIVRIFAILAKRFLSPSITLELRDGGISFLGMGPPYFVIYIVWFKTYQTHWRLESFTTPAVVLLLKLTTY